MKSLYFLLSALCLSLGPAAYTQQYTIEDLGTLSATPTDGVRAAGINNRGHVHGDNDRTAPSGLGIQQRSFLWMNGTMEHIPPPIMGSTWKGDINDDDMCVGNFTFSSLDFHGYLWSSSILNPFVVGNHNFTKPTAINSAGVIAGTFTSDTVVGLAYRNHAFVRGPSGAFLDLGTLGGMDSYGEALNDHRHVVGKARNAADVFRGFEWSLQLGMVELDSLGGSYDHAQDINNWGDIVGRSKNLAGDFQPCLWRSGVVTALPTLGGASGNAKSINDYGEVVGNSLDSNSLQLACLWMNGSVVDLNTTLVGSGGAWLLTGASDVNELGEICGTGLLNGEQRAYKLTPVLTSSRVSGFLPGFAGQVNRMFGFGFTPGSTVDIYAGRNAGSTSTACGAIVGIANARLITSTVADAVGRIEFELNLPRQAAGVGILLQTVEPASCAVGELRNQVLQ
ncbi:MAG: hypothetical protein QF489_00910 [Planctomycetota bacterium]|jgi:probable HAF family extracellular repeat protein|nr:hypothetical protein [Planctomycetota bacterium]